MKANNDTLLIFLLFKSDNKKSNTIEIIKKIECLFTEKYSSIEKERIRPVMPKDNIKIKLILSIEFHQFLKYSIVKTNSH